MMAGRRFSLATLLNLRKREEDSARAEFGRKAAAAAAAEAEVARCFQQLTADSVPANPSPEAFRAITASKVALKSLYEEAQVLRDQRVSEQQQAESAWRSAHQKTEAIDRLRERHEETVKAEQLKAEQAQIDDIVNTNYSTDAGELHQEE